MNNNTPEKEISCVVTNGCVGGVDGPSFYDGDVHDCCQKVPVENITVEKEILSVSGGVRESEVSGGVEENKVSGGVQESEVSGGVQEAKFSGGVQESEVSIACHFVENHAGVSVASDPAHLDAKKSCCVVSGGVSGGDSGVCESVPGDDNCCNVKDQNFSAKSVSCVVCGGVDHLKYCGGCKSTHYCSKALL